MEFPIALPWRHRAVFLPPGCAPFAEPLPKLNRRQSMRKALPSLLDIRCRRLVPKELGSAWVALLIEFSRIPLYIFSPDSLPQQELFGVEEAAQEIFQAGTTVFGFGDEVRSRLQFGLVWQTADGGDVQLFDDLAVGFAGG